MAYTPISNLPTPPSRQEPSTFSVRADAFLGALPTFGTQVNAAGDFIDGVGAQVATDTATASAAAAGAELAKTIAQAAANYKGDYNAGTTYQIGQSVSFEGKVYAAKTVNTGVTPADGANWLDITLADVRTPVITSPTAGQTGVLPTPTIVGGPYAPLYSADTRAHRLFQIDLASGDFSAPVVSGQVNADSFTVASNLALETNHKVRIKDVSVTGAESAFSEVVTFQTANITVNAPTLTVEGSPTEVPETPTLTTGAFATTPSGQDTHASTNWIVRLAADDTIVYQSLADTVNLLSIVVPEGNLLVDTQYKFQVQHVGTTYGASAVTEVVATTLSQFAPAIGDAFGGGFFTGEIWLNGGELYRLVVAPKASGESTSQQFKTSRTASPADTQTLNNGLKSTTAMVSAGSHPAAAFCAGLTIGGFSDWYLPARDELELAYRNLKPTTDANSTSGRTASAIVYPVGNDLSSDTAGVNKNSNPTGSAYTSGNPVQTSVAVFQAGGAEAFSVDYWTSSEYSSERGWYGNFTNGFQGDAFKDLSVYARAFRRELISPEIGDFIYGGYFGGTIYEGGQAYYLIVAPKASGENASVAFKTTQTASPAATRTLNNGPAATAAMVAAGDHPAAAFCAGLTINGFSDWYLPARDELEILYRTLKPTTTANNTASRALSSITYPEGNDLSADTMGFNRNSVNINTGYTSTIPPQTGLALFQAGGEEGFAESNYWSSSEASDTEAWRQLFSSGSQFLTAKDSLRYARAIRRVAV